MFTIGSWVFEKPTILAPMAGVTDMPYRKLCRQLGASLAVSEMLASDSKLWKSRKSQYRLAHVEDLEPRSIQLAGNVPNVIAEAARANVDMGAQIIDINMGCPAKKVCKKAAGSALLNNESLVESILRSVVSAVNVPVTLKIRTGSDTTNKNGVRIAKIAEATGIQALAVHGRTRACGFKGPVEYDTIAEIAAAVNIPVFANGDITSPERAKAVLDYTGAKAVMVGRGAQGNPWLFREINHFLETGKRLELPPLKEVSTVAKEHLRQLHTFYGELMGLRIARKHIGWYLQYLENPHLGVSRQGKNADTPSDGCSYHLEFRKRFNRIESAQDQRDELASHFETLANTEEKAA